MSNTHGDFADNAEAAQDIKNVFLQYTTQLTGCEPPAFVYEALDLIATKLSRIVTGDPWCARHWRGIAAYAKLVEDRLVAADAAAPDEFNPVLGPWLDCDYRGADASDAGALSAIVNKR